jgi:hypothetical protein
MDNQSEGGEPLAPKPCDHRRIGCTGTPGLLPSTTSLTSLHQVEDGGRRVRRPKAEVKSSGFMAPWIHHFSIIRAKISLIKKFHSIFSINSADYIERNGNVGT